MNRSLMASVVVLVILLRGAPPVQLQVAPPVLQQTAPAIVVQETPLGGSTTIPQGVVYEAPPLYLDSGCLGINVRSAHEHSPGLRDVTIRPGESWSFDANWRIESDLVNCAGENFPGGGVCNQAARYSNVAHGLGLQVDSQYHGWDYDTAVPSADNITIMSNGEWGGQGGQDVIIHNTSTQIIHIVATIEGDQLYVKGWKE